MKLEPELVLDRGEDRRPGVVVSERFPSRCEGSFYIEALWPASGSMRWIEVRRGAMRLATIGSIRFWRSVPLGWIGFGETGLGWLPRRGGAGRCRWTAFERTL